MIKKTNSIFVSNSNGSKKNMLRIFKEHKTGILGTIAFHLLLLVIFMVIKISTMYSYLEGGIMIDFEAEPEFELINDQTEVLPMAANMLQDVTHGTNIPVNIAQQALADQETNDEIENRIRELTEKYLTTDKPADNEEADIISESQLEEDITNDLSNEDISFKGESNIEYELENRSYKYLPVPVYKCEESGEVTIEITVNRRGYIINTKIIESSSSGDTDCLNAAAMRAATNTIFNTDYNATARQLGTITYKFIAQ